MGDETDLAFIDKGGPTACQIIKDFKEVKARSNVENVKMLGGKDVKNAKGGEN